MKIGLRVFLLYCFFLILRRKLPINCLAKLRSHLIGPRAKRPMFKGAPTENQKSFSFKKLSRAKRPVEVDSDEISGRFDQPNITNQGN